MAPVIRSLGVLLILAFSGQFILMGVEAQSNCQSSFLNLFYQCVSNSTLNPQHFLWLTRDGNMGSKPPDLPAFTQQACQQDEKLVECFKKISDQFASISACSDADKNAIQNFYKNVVINLDSKCAHPCRAELVSSLGECFTSAEVNATLFLSNVTLPRHRMLGDTDDEIDMFCMKREEILECMKTKTEMCPETPDILLAAGIDVDAMNNTVALLCDNRQLYLHGARCSVNRSLEEERCQDQLLEELSDLETQFQALSIDRDTYAVNVCRLRLDHIRCDLNSLGRRDNDTKCPDVVVGLRREQECTLLPADCRQKFKDRVMDMCDPLRFLIDKRDEFIQLQQSKTPSSGHKALPDFVFLMFTVPFFTVITWFH